MGAFTLSAVTGVLMFFHLDSGLNKAAHEWLSWAMVGGGRNSQIGYIHRSAARAVTSEATAQAASSMYITMIW